MRLGQTSIIFILSRAIASAIGFFSTVYFTRLLGKEVYGFYAITLAVVSWLGITVTIGLGGAIIKRMSEGNESGAYLAAGIAIKTATSAIIIIGVVVFQDQVNSYVGEPVTGFIILLLIVSLISGLVNSALKGTHQVHIFAPLSTVKKVAQNSIMVALVFIGWELTGMLFGRAIGAVLISVLGVYFIPTRLTVPEWQHIKSLFEYGKYAWLGSLRKESFRSADIIVLGFFVSAGFTGIYAVSYTLAKFLDIFGSAIQTTLFPELSKRNSEGDDSMVKTLTNDALSFNGLFLIPGIVGGTLLGDRLMRVYGDGFEEGAPVLSILLVGILAYSYNKQLLNTLNAIDRPDLAFRANAVFIGTNLILNVALVYTIGWIGAAIATATSATMGLIFGFYYTRRQVGFQVPVGEISRQLIAALLMGGAVYLARIAGETHPVSTHNSVFVVLLVGFGAIVYFSVLLVLSKRLRTTINRNLPFSIPVVRRSK